MQPDPASVERPGARRRSSFIAALALLGAAVAGLAHAAPTLPPLNDRPTGLRYPGKFVWFDLATGDPAAAKSFYGKVFGWSFEPAPGAPDYATILAADRRIGGVFRPAAAGGSVGTRWLGFVSVADVDRSIATLKEQGFTVLVGAVDVPGRGRQAIVRDAQGAVVGLLQSASGDPPDDPVQSGDFFWVDLYARDAAAAAAAYERIGYTVSPADETRGDRLLLAAGGYARAGITPLPPEGRAPGWLPYVQVDDVAATVAAATAAGGKVLRAPDPAVFGGNVAVIADPLGGVIGVIHWAPPEAPAKEQR